MGGWGGGSTPLGGFFRRVRGGGEKKNPGAEKFPGGVARHAPTLAMGPYSASCLVNKVQPERDSISQAPKEKEACSMAKDKKVAYRAPAAQACNPPFLLPVT